ncbi:hypothetical protein CN575_13900 [Bacillus wiedmannii]|uniref:hypothetical protein n=1 Tax=Bacillus TaxID=1386 RepID=UPI000BF9E2A2|nr:MULTISPECIES: hypothetical protein [Bacillus]PEP34175.1 hypothetical protein CN575_13900 [Bacillus wiedmannii]PHF29884.1 hypothetical protein COF82_16505 [Bacillus wiedmannii]
MLCKKQIGYVLILVGFFTLIVMTLFFQDYEYIRYIKGAGFICWVVSIFLIPEYEPKKVSKGR